MAFLVQHSTLLLIVFGLLVLEALLRIGPCRLFDVNLRSGQIIQVIIGLALLATPYCFAAVRLTRCRFQFSIRSLLVLVVVVALPCSWLAVEMKKAMEQKAAAELIAASDASVSFDIEDVDTDPPQQIPAGQIPTVYQILCRPEPRLIPRPPLPEPIRGLFLRLLGESFFCTATAVSVHDSNEGQWADLSPNKYEEREVAHAIMIALKGLPELQTLDISGMPADDSDLEYITPLKELRLLCLRGTHVTDAGVAKLQQALPNCKITR